MNPTIVVPLDGSDRSEAAVPLAAEAAEALDAEVLLVTAGWGRTDEALAGLHERVAAQHLTHRAWRSATVPDTFPADAIRDLTPDDGTVIMTTRGRSGISRVVLGSVAEDVVGSAHQPVVLIGPSAKVTTLRGAGLVLALDGGELSASIVDPALAWAAALEMSVRVVAVTHPDGAPVGGGGADGLSRQLDGVAERAHTAGASVHVERLVADDAAGALVDMARGLPAGLVAMSTRARRGVARAALGSTTMSVVRDATCPVLVLRPDDADGDGGTDRPSAGADT